MRRVRQKNFDVINKASNNIFWDFPLGKVLLITVFKNAWLMLSMFNKKLRKTILLIPSMKREYTYEASIFCGDFFQSQSLSWFQKSSKSNCRKFSEIVKHPNLHFSVHGGFKVLTSIIFLGLEEEVYWLPDRFASFLFFYKLHLRCLFLV